MYYLCPKLTVFVARMYFAKRRCVIHPCQAGGNVRTSDILVRRNTVKCVRDLIMSWGSVSCVCHAGFSPVYLGPPWPIRSSDMSVGVRAHISTLAFDRLGMSVQMPRFHVVCANSIVHEKN